MSGSGVLGVMASRCMVTCNYDAYMVVEGDHGIRVFAHIWRVLLLYGLPSASILTGTSIVSPLNISE